MTSSRINNLPKLLQRGLQHLQAGQLQQAEQFYQQILAQQPNHAEANHFLGIIACQLGQFERGAGFIRQALTAHPRYAEAYKSLGKALQETGELQEAAGNFRQALALRPNYPEAFNDLGNTLNDLEQFDEAIACFKKAIKLRPNFFIAYNNLGNVLQEQGNFDEAIACFKKAIGLQPALAVLHLNLGNGLKKKELYEEAIASYEKALAIQPNYPEALNQIGNALYKMERLDDARVFFQKALAYKPDYGFAHSNLLTLMNYLADVTQQEIFAEAQLWDTRQTRSLLPAKQAFSNTPDPNRRLRIGYVSPDFSYHSVAYFFEPLIAAHDRNAFEIFCYANVEKQDRVTERIKALSDHWCSIIGKDDDGVAQQISNDKIDILVDLAGHSKNNSLPVFARKPAPVQVAWLGYPNTTGLQAIDYRLTDAIADPAGQTDKLHSETLVRLQHGFLCYQADNSAPEVVEPPCLQNEFITFGSFNNLNKVTPKVIRWWATILKEVPGSQLLLKSKKMADNGCRDRFVQLFADQGITEDRLQLYGFQPHKKDHFGLYNQVDIGLDPFPYSGTTTTCEALWMGVPVVTLRGERHSSRVGASIMHHIGLDELVAKSLNDYVELCRGLSNDHQRLVTMRAILRQQMRGSQLMDREIFTKDIEDAYREMWSAWCNRRK